VALRRVLQSRRRRLEEDLRFRVARIRDPGAGAPHTLEADEDPTDLDVSLIEIANDTLRVIDAAIERLNRGEYGHCTRCHGQISVARLRAMPFALRCRECEMIRERESALERSNSRRKSWDREGAVFAVDERL
jgi:DnaK suppressor protein